MVDFLLSELPIPERYQLMTRAVAPRPIAFVSSMDGKGRGNLSPFSYFTIGGANPPSCVICPLYNRETQAKDTLLNIRETGEYTISVVTFAMAEKANQTSWTYERGVDEFDEVGFKRNASTLVKPPWVAESPVGIECRLHEIVQHGDGPLAGSYIIGEMLLMHVAQEVMTDGQIDNAKLDSVARLGGDYYCTTRPDSLFELKRPTGP